MCDARAQRPDPRSCMRPDVQGERGAWHQSSISANSCSSAAAWTSQRGIGAMDRQPERKSRPAMGARRRTAAADQRLGRTRQAGPRRRSAPRRRERTVECPSSPAPQSPFPRPRDDAATAMIDSIRRHLQRHQRIAADHSPSVGRRFAPRSRAAHRARRSSRAGPESRRDGNGSVQAVRSASGRTSGPLTARAPALRRGDAPVEKVGIC